MHMTLNTTRSEVPHICVISLLFTSSKFHPVSLYDQTFLNAGNFETNALHDLKGPWPLQGQRYPIYICYYIVSRSPKSQSVSLYYQPLLRYEAAKTASALNDLGLTLNVNGQKHRVYTKYHRPRPKFGQFRSTTSHFQDLADFLIFHWLQCYPPPNKKNAKNAFKKLWPRPSLGVYMTFGGWIRFVLSVVVWFEFFFFHMVPC